MLFAFFMGCWQACPTTYDTLVDESIGEVSERSLWEVSLLHWWLQDSCVALVRVTENAPAGGDSWRTDQGWILTAAPGRTMEYDLRENLCRAYALEHRVLQRGGEGLFVDTDTQTALDSFIDLCSHGPTERTYIDAEVAACGMQPMTQQEAFLEEEVFIARSRPTAPEWPLEMVGSADVVGFNDKSTGVPTIADLPTGGWLFPQRNSRVLGTIQLNHSALDGRRTHTFIRFDHEVYEATSDDTHLYFLGPIGEGKFGYWRVERSTNAIRHQELTWTEEQLPLWSDTEMTRGPNWTALSTRTRLHSSIGMIFDDGSTKLVSLSAPSGSYEANGFLNIWADPTSPDHLYAQVVEGDYDPEWGLYPHTSHVVRIHLPSRDIESVWRPSTEISSLIHTPIGISNDGSLVFEIAVSNDQFVAGTLDSDTGRLRVSHDVCYDQRGTMENGQLSIYVQDGVQPTVQRWAPSVR